MTYAPTQPIWLRIPLVRTLASEWLLWRKDRRMPQYRRVPTPPDYAALPLYPIAMDPLLAMPFGYLDENGILFNAPTAKYPGSYQPTSIAQFALAHWNRYLEAHDDSHRETFLRHAYWLLHHEVRAGRDGDIGVWPIPFPMPEYGARTNWLSALTQGNVISVFIRAYRLGGDTAFMEAAHRAAHAFEREILDGGVSIPVGDDGVFFEEVAVYPSSQILNGFLLALFGLYDYVAVAPSPGIEALIQRGLRTLHTFIDEYDMGFWSRYDLLHRRPASRFYHALHIVLLQVLSHYSGCAHCAAVAQRWMRYQRRPICRLRYWLASRRTRYVRGMWRALQRRIFSRHPATSHGAHVDTMMRVCVPITAFPVAGGMRSVLAGVFAVMRDEWRFEFLARQIGADRQGYTIHGFGGRAASPWYMPTAWLYCLAGWRKLTWLMLRGRGYYVLLPQDGVFSGAFSALAAKLTGVRLVCMDHGTVTLPYSPVYRAERLRLAAQAPQPKRLVLRALLIGYWASLRLLTRVTVRCADHFLVAGEEVMETYRKRFGVPERRITRYPYVVDLARIAPLDADTRARLRADIGIGADDMVVTMINRLAPEKGVEIAMEGIGSTLSALPPERRALVRVIIAGDGPLRGQVEGDCRRHGIEKECLLWGEAAPKDVGILLAISDVFLYTGTRGTNYSMAVLEAMAAGCAVVASVEPQSNAHLLAEGRGIPIPVGDVGAIHDALTRLVNDRALCWRMGTLAREYVATYHSALALKRCLQRATYWPGAAVMDTMDTEPAALRSHISSDTPIKVE